jgi:hypothetical protein
MIEPIGHSQPAYFYMMQYENLACPARFERATYALEGRCSIQLSYGQLYAGLSRTIRESGRSTRIRTLDPLLPKQVRYQAALHSDGTAILH